MADDSPTPASADVRERFARALYFAAQEIGPESWYVPENDPHWERWKNEGDPGSPSPLAVADALIAAFPAIAQSPASADVIEGMREALSKIERLIAQCEADMESEQTKDDPDSESVGWSKKGPLPMTFGHIRDGRRALTFLRATLALPDSPTTHKGDGS